MSLSSHGASAQRPEARFSERRKLLGCEVRSPVFLSGSDRSEGTIKNLSTGGCAVHVMASYQTDEEVLLVFVLPG
ncbi:PilZ domain-containing protein [Nitrospira sp. Nam74]